MSIAGSAVRPGVEASILEEYRRLTPVSRSHWDRLKALTPAGQLSTMGFLPYPVFVERVDGAHLYDVDSREILDFFGAHSGALHGHNHPAVREAIRAELDHGTIFGLVRSTRELEVAEQLVARIPSLEKVRFSPTGSEATMRALRVARAFTGRHRIAKTDLGYHGNHDLVWYGPEITHAQHPGTRELAPGISPSVKDEVLLLPFNDAEGSAELLSAHADSVAAVIVEPILGGSWLPATVEYLEALRELCTRHGVVLIFDEMICLGVARGGAQELFGVVPDLTTAGKTVAAGMPLAFYGGRADIMDVTGRGEGGEVPAVIHGGTYQRHNLSMVAATVALAQQDDAFFERLQAKGEQLRGVLRALAERRGWPIEVCGVSHLWSVHWMDEPGPLDVSSMPKVNRRMRALLQAMALNRGIHHISGIVTDAHTDEHVRTLCSVLEASVDELGIGG